MVFKATKIEEAFFKDQNLICGFDTAKITLEIEFNRFLSIWFDTVSEILSFGKKTIN